MQAFQWGEEMGGPHRRLTGLGIASGSILCLDFCTAGSSDACFTFTRLSGKLGKIERVEIERSERRVIHSLAGRERVSETHTHARGAHTPSSQLVATRSVS